MALNAPLGPNGVPFRLNDEFILLERPGMDIEIKMAGRSNITGKGKVYLTTSRMVFVHDKFMTDKFKSFDMPIAFLVKPKFEQPIFGANYLQFTVKPISHTLPLDANVKLWFSKGGCEKFLRIYEYVSKQVYEQKRTQRMNNNLYNNWATGYFQNNNAFVDPSDPTVIITEQPPIFNPNNQYIGENIYVNPNTNYPDLGPDVEPPQPKPSGQSGTNQYAPNLGKDQPLPGAPNAYPQAPTGYPQQSPPNQYPGNQSPFGQAPTGYGQPPQPPTFGQAPTGYGGQSPQQPNSGQMYPQQQGTFGQPPTGFGQPPTGYNQPPNFGQPPTGYGQPGNQFANNPNYQNVPNAQNPMPAVNQNQNNNAGYYFGFWGPQLERGHQ